MTPSQKYSVFFSFCLPSLYSCLIGQNTNLIVKEHSFLLFTEAFGHCHGNRAGYGCNTIAPENIQPYYFTTPSVPDKSQWLWVMWLDWLFSISWLSCPPAPVSQTEEQYVSQQGCQTHPSQMLRGNMRVWPRENNSAPNPSSMTSRYKRLFLYSCLGFCGAVRIVFTILWLAEARCERKSMVLWLKVVDWIIRLWWGVL